MYQRQTVDQYRHIVAIAVGAPFGLILIDDLKGIVVNIGLVDERDVDQRPVRALPGLDIILLNATGLLDDTHVRIAYILLEGVDLLRVVKFQAVQPLYL